jgi:hypothetical protein
VLAICPPGRMGIAAFRELMCNDEYYVYTHSGG